jgi:hypothetical protein
MKTLYEMAQAALARLGDIEHEDIQVHDLRETVIELEFDGDVGGFVVQQYRDGDMRQAYFYIGLQEAPLSGAQLEAVMAFIYPSPEPT